MASPTSGIDPAAAAKILEEMDEATIERYAEDEAFRTEYGPSIDHYGNYGENNALEGLRIVLDYGHFGTCIGTVRAHGSDELKAVWTCSPKHDEEFEINMEADQIIAFYFHGRGSGEQPDWFSNEEDYGKHVSSFLCLPEGTKLVDWAVPLCASDFDLGILDDEDPNKKERWRATVARLTDPDAARILSPGIKGFPTTMVLTTLLICKDLDSYGTKLPTLITEENKEVFELADKFTRQLSNGNVSKIGRLQKLVQQVAAEVKKQKVNNWRQAYNQVQALILTLSDSFERPNRGWTYSNDLEMVDEISKRIVEVVSSVLLHPPSEEMQGLVDKDMAAFLLEHLKAGSFSDFVEEDDFAEAYPAVAETWTQLVGNEEGGE
ncbi:expressed unknown protein [Seminavis robusta]|uniref:Uncharacterized protein n=1 Tax=Seminavis robusta TaxID=568900 RepID=A0A9N8DDH6_9STRA|nr:expressed unknown protein [Seminavis robusta]|eukprot:Sro44_g026720.1 n/a (378) ;mRNA; r:129166-130435